MWKRIEMADKSFMDRNVFERSYEEECEFIDSDLKPFLGELTRRMDRAKVISYINRLPSKAKIDVEEVADKCQVKAEFVVEVLNGLKAEGFFDE